jgi:hypothetical protein
LKGFRERCKEIEKELENVKINENNSIFGNSMMVGHTSTMIGGTNNNNNNTT